MHKKGLGNSIIRFHDTRNIFFEFSNDNILQENKYTLLLLADVDQIIIKLLMPLLLKDSKYLFSLLNRMFL